MTDSKRRILIVEDDAPQREMYAAVLAAAGFEVHEAKDGLEALEKVDRLGVHLVLVDVSMPFVDGFEVARVLRKDPKTSGLSILAISASTSETYEKDAKEAGCDAAIRKTLPLGSIIEEVGRLLAGKPA